MTICVFLYVPILGGCAKLSSCLVLYLRVFCLGYTKLETHFHCFGFSQIASTKVLPAAVSSIRQMASVTSCVFSFGKPIGRVRVYMMLCWAQNKNKYDRLIPTL